MSCNPCCCLKLKDGAVTIGIWSTVYSIMQLGIYGWQMAAIKYERDRAANTLLPNYNTYGRYDIPTYYESYWQSPEERYYTGLFVIQVLCLIVSFFLLFASVMMVYGIHTWTRCLVWPWIVVMMASILTSLAYCIMWWAGDVRDYWLLLTIVEFFGVLVNIYFFVVICAFHRRMHVELKYYENKRKYDRFDHGRSLPRTIEQDIDEAPVGEWAWGDHHEGALKRTTDELLREPYGAMKPARPISPPRPPQIPERRSQSAMERPYEGFRSSSRRRKSSRHRSSCKHCDHHHHRHHHHHRQREAEISHRRRPSYSSEGYSTGTEDIALGRMHRREQLRDREYSRIEKDGRIAAPTPTTVKSANYTNIPREEKQQKSKPAAPRPPAGLGMRSAGIQTEFADSPSFPRQGITIPQHIVIPPSMPGSRDTAERRYHINSEITISYPEGATPSVPPRQSHPAPPRAESITSTV